MTFDVFLAHNSSDKPTVEKLAKTLRDDSKLKVWFDVWNLVPGQPWQPLMESGIQESGAGAVLVGSDGIGPWENEEMRALLSQAVKNGIAVIPVLLPGAPLETKLPPFLAARTFVDFRDGITKEKLELLVWGITGIRPESHESAPPIDDEEQRKFCIEAKRAIDELKAETRDWMANLSEECIGLIKSRFRSKLASRKNPDGELSDWLIDECEATKAVSGLNRIAENSLVSRTDVSILGQICRRLIPLRYHEKIKNERDQLAKPSFEIITTKNGSIAEVILAAFDSRELQFREKLGMTAFEFIEVGDFGFGAEVDKSVAAFFKDALNAWEVRFGRFEQQTSGNSLDDLARRFRANVTYMESKYESTVYCLLKLPIQEAKRRRLEKILKAVTERVPSLVFCHIDDQTDDEVELLLTCISDIPD